MPGEVPVVVVGLFVVVVGGTPGVAAVVDVVRLDVVVAGAGLGVPGTHW